MSTRQILDADELAIMRAVLYASLFEYPLTVTELRRTLVEHVLDEPAILRTYRSSARLGTVLEYQHGFFFPRGRGDWIGRRRRRQATSLALLERNRRVLKAICAIPFVRLVALSGSVAALNADHDADLDLFLVTKGRCAWSVTLALVLLAKLARRRRLICANFVMTDADLSVEHQDLFSANQIVHLQPIFGEQTFADFLAANRFVEQIYPNVSTAEPREFLMPLGSFPRIIKTTLERVLAIPLRAIEPGCRLVYGWYLRRQAAASQTPDEVRLSSDCLKLHTHGHREATLRRFDRLCREALHRAEEAPTAEPHDCRLAVASWL